MPEAALYSAVPSYRQLYVSYLSTSSLVDAIRTIEAQLSTNRGHITRDKKALLFDIRDDLKRELAGRQLTIPGA